jgi:hypothetical protein
MHKGFSGVHPACLRCTSGVHALGASPARADLRRFTGLAWAQPLSRAGCRLGPARTILTVNVLQGRAGDNTLVIVLIGRGR